MLKLSTGWIFHLTGTPAVRDGMFFAVPGVIIEITRECSGIRSTIATLITCLLAGYLILQGTRNRAVLLLVAVPVVILKNGIRISTLTLLAVHVDPAFLDGRLHHDGGVVFFLTGLALLLPVLWGLHRTEAGPANRDVSRFAHRECPGREHPTWVGRIAAAAYRRGPLNRMARYAFRVPRRYPARRNATQGARSVRNAG